MYVVRCDQYNKIPEEGGNNCPTEPYLMATRLWATLLDSLVRLPLGAVNGNTRDQLDHPDYLALLGACHFLP